MSSQQSLAEGLLLGAGIRGSPELPACHMSIKMASGSIGETDINAPAGNGVGGSVQNRKGWVIRTGYWQDLLQAGAAVD